MSARKRVKREQGDGLDLPDTVDLDSVNAAEIKVVQAAGQGRIDVREAILFSRMLEHRRRAIGDQTLEEKMDRAAALRTAGKEKP